MKGGQCSVGARVSALGSTYSGAPLRAEASTASWKSTAGWPCSVGTWSERVEALGGGRSHYLDACGRLGRRDERTRQALRCTSRSLVSAPAVHHRGSRWRRPAAGWGSSIHPARVTEQTEV